MSAPTPPALALLRDRNRLAILAFELFWGLGIPFVYHYTVVPAFLKDLRIGEAWIGLVPALQNGTVAVVQPLSAYRLGPGTRRLRPMRYTYLLGTLAFVLLGALALAGLSRPAALYLATAGACVLFAICLGLGDPQYMELTVAAVPTELRGRYFALRSVFFGLGGIAGGELAARTLASCAAPRNYAISFIAGGLLLAFSTLTMWFYRERPPEGEPQPRESLAAYLRERMLPYARQPDFRVYLAAAVLFTLAACGFPFVGLLVREKLGGGDSLAGLLGGVVMGCNLTMSWVLGVACDRWGSRTGMALALLLFAAGVGGCLLLNDRFGLLASYFVAAIWMPGQLIAMTDLALKLASDRPPAEVTATMMVSLTPAKLLGPVAVGAAAARWGYGWALGACVLCAGLALLTLVWRGAPRAAVT